MNEFGIISLIASIIFFIFVLLIKPTDHKPHQEK